MFEDPNDTSMQPQPSSSSMAAPGGFGQRGRGRGGAQPFGGGNREGFRGRGMAYGAHLVSPFDPNQPSTQPQFNQRGGRFQRGQDSRGGGRGAGFDRGRGRFNSSYHHTYSPYGNYGNWQKGNGRGRGDNGGERSHFRGRGQQTQWRGGGGGRGQNMHFTSDSNRGGGVNRKGENASIPPRDFIIPAMRANPWAELERERAIKRSACEAGEHIDFDA